MSLARDPLFSKFLLFCHVLTKTVLGPGDSDFRDKRYIALNREKSNKNSKHGFYDHENDR